jgi:hypothetical protein
MSAELKDLRTKVPVRTWCLLEAESRATSRDVAELAREIINAWAEHRWHACIEAEKLLRAEGEPGIAAGVTGHREESRAVGVEPRL